ncbi:MAG: hypothetical protein GY861_05345 [bacterium]|nr:hypothetical protein [bacterium]
MGYGGITFRDQINNNKKKIVEYLKENGEQYTSDITRRYNGQKEQAAVRKALNELRKEGIITTDDKVRIWRGKRWWIC